MRADYHIHTNYSIDSKVHMEEYIPLMKLMIKSFGYMSIKKEKVKWIIILNIIKI